MKTLTARTHSGLTTLGAATGTLLFAFGRVLLVGALVFYAPIVFIGGQDPLFAQAEPCPNEAFRTGPSAHLPDCRAYEQVSPPEKDSGKLAFTGVGSNEETVSFTSLAGFAGAESGEGLPGFAYVAERGEGGWGTSSVTPSAQSFLNLNAGHIKARAGAVEGQSGDRRTTLWLLHEEPRPGHAVPAGQAGFYLTHVGGGAPQELGPALPPGAPSVIHEEESPEAPVEVEGLSADASQVFFSLRYEPPPRQPVHGWSADTEPGALLEYHGTCGGPSECEARQPLPVGVENVENGGGPVDGCPTQRLGGQLRSEANANAESGWTHNAVSSLPQPGGPGAGEVVFLTDTCAAAEGKHQLYTRIENGAPGARTVSISEPSKGDCSSCETFAGEPVKRSPAYFVGASRDGSKVFWTTSQPLLGGDSTENVYEYNFDATNPDERVTRISAPAGSVADPGPANVQGVVQVSEDGSHVYFVARGVLTGAPNGLGQTASLGAYNLYVFDSGTGTTAFIATLASNDSELWKGSEAIFSFPFASDVTPDGRFLVFTSHADLTPDDESTAAQIFEYDAQTGSLVRVSIGLNGYNNDGNTKLATKLEAGLDSSLEDPNDARLPEFAANYSGEYSADSYYNELPVSSDGSYVFFESSDALVPQALDHHRIYPIAGGELEEAYGAIYAKNVYEYHAGNVYLISDGQDVSSSEGGSYVSLFGTDPSGRDVYFKTADQLVGQDTDSQVDIYDARIDGGFPAPLAPAECAGNTCGGASNGAPTLLSAGSELQVGGNTPLAPVPAAPAAKPKKKTIKCPKGKELARGKCVKPKKNKSKTSAHKSAKARH